MRHYSFDINETYTEETIYNSLQEWLNSKNNPIHTFIRPPESIDLIIEDDGVAAEFESEWQGAPYTIR